MSALAAPTVREMLDACRAAADSDIAGLRRKGSTPRLYSILADCLRACEECLSRPGAETELRELVKQQPREGNRRYVERGSDVYVLVTRYVFVSEANRTNANRYAHTLREAAKRGLTSDVLADHLCEAGGINALYLARPLDRDTVETKALRLDRAITVHKDEPFTLRLRRLPDNTYEVLDIIARAARAGKEG
jgi:hypothetical protein